MYEGITDETTPTPSPRAVIKNIMSSLIKLTPSIVLTGAAIALYPEFSAYMTNMISSIPDTIELTGIISGTAAGCKIFTAVTNEFVTKKLCNQFYPDKIRKESQKKYVQEKRKKTKPTQSVELAERAVLLDIEVKTPTTIPPSSPNAYLQLLIQSPQPQPPSQRTPHSKKRTPQGSPDSKNKMSTPSKTGLFNGSPTKAEKGEKEKPVSRRLSYSGTSRRPSLSIADSIS